MINQYLVENWRAGLNASLITEVLICLDMSGSLFEETGTLFPNGNKKLFQMPPRIGSFNPHWPHPPGAVKYDY